MFDCKRRYDGAFDIRDLNVNLEALFWKNTYSFNLDGTTYFIKEKGYLEGIKELLAEELATIYKIDHASYDLCICNNNVSSVSRNIAKENEEYLSLFDVVYSDNNDINGLPDNFNNINDMKNIIIPALNITNIENSLRKYINIILFDITIANDDRNAMNIGFIKDNNGYRIAPIFDNGNMCSSRAINEHIYKTGIEREDVRLRRFDDKNKKIDLVKKIIENYTDTYGKDLKDYLEVLTDENIDLAFKRVEEKLGKEVSFMDKFNIMYDLKLNRDNIFDLMKPFYQDVKTYKKVK